MGDRGPGLVLQHAVRKRLAGVLHGAGRGFRVDVAVGEALEHEEGSGDGFAAVGGLADEESEVLVGAPVGLQEGDAKEEGEGDAVAGLEREIEIPAVGGFGGEDVTVGEGWVEVFHGVENEGDQEPQQRSVVREVEEGCYGGGGNGPEVAFDWLDGLALGGAPSSSAALRVAEDDELLG